jgi:hypothetical protein
VAEGYGIDIGSGNGGVRFDWNGDTDAAMQIVYLVPLLFMASEAWLLGNQWVHQAQGQRCPFSD